MHEYGINYFLLKEITDDEREEGILSCEKCYFGGYHVKCLKPSDFDKDCEMYKYFVRCENPELIRRNEVKGD